MLHLNMVINNSMIFFNPLVWGTVSDWVVVLVTALTARYLWKTLQSQLKVQELQGKITLIENDRYRQEHVPKFKFKIIDHELTKDSNGVSAWFLISIELTNNIAYKVDLKVLPWTSGMVFKQNVDVVQDFVQVGFQEKLRVDTLTPTGEFDMSNGEFSCVLLFSDPAGNNYRHVATITFDYTSKNIYADPIPELIVT